MEELPVGIERKRKWQGKLIILETKVDKHTFEYQDVLKELYKNPDVYVLYEGVGHHIMFFFPKKYIKILSQYLG